MVNNNTKELALASVTSILTGVEAAHFFSAKLPSTMTIRSFVDTEDAANAIWDGLAKANIGGLLLGGLITGASYLAKMKYWWLPGLATVGMCGFMSWSYWDDMQQAPITRNAEEPDLGETPPAIF